MGISERQKAAHIRESETQYAEGHALLSWITPEAAARAEAQRRELLDAISSKAAIGASGTKMDMARLSPGCRICVAGRWSCLFVNGRCNGRCFYCPTPQDAIGHPETNTLSFSSSADYTAYVETFGFTGVSISGGEPLLTLDRALDYISAVKDRFGDRVHTWLYTNGTRATRENLTALRNAGLDEIRFNIGATAYHLKKASLASGRIPTVTVEIPAVPEETERLKKLTAAMADAGISHLNLHHLRLTPHNFRHLVNRPYTFLHGELVTVLESELAALEILHHVLSRGIDIGVNYCSFVYKHTYQKAAARRRAGEMMRKPYEEITEMGFIRTLFFSGEIHVLNWAAERLKADAEIPAADWLLDAKAGRLYLPAAAADRLAGRPDVPPGLTLQAGYAEAMLLPAITYNNPFREIRLTRHQKIFVERARCLAPTPLPAEISGGASIAETLAAWEPAASFEAIPHGLSAYY